MNRQVKTTLLVCLSVLFMSGIWAIDIGASIMSLESAGFPAQAGSLFFMRTGSQQYHLGLLFAFISFIGVLLVCLFGGKK